MASSVFSGPAVSVDSSVTNTNVDKMISEGATLVPCRFGKKGDVDDDDDDEKNEYVVVPKDVKHGDGLLSSQIERRGTIKFVFCKVCDKPVARQTFHTEHEHLDDQKTGAKRAASEISRNHHSDDHDKDNDDMPQDVVRGSNKSSSNIWKETSDVSSSADSRSASPDPTKRDRRNKKKKNSPDSAKRSPVSETHGGGSSTSGSRTETRSSSNNSSSDTPSLSLSNLSSRQGSLTSVEKEWFSLLQKRPPIRDTKKMKAWLRGVIFASESRTQPSNNNSNNNTNNTHSTEYSASDEQSSSPVGESSTNSTDDSDSTEDRVGVAQLVGESLKFARASKRATNRSSCSDSGSTDSRQSAKETDSGEAVSESYKADS